MLNKREQFAAAAMHAILTNVPGWAGYGRERRRLCRQAFAVADAMLELCEDGEPSGPTRYLGQKCETCGQIHHVVAECENAD